MFLCLKKSLCLQALHRILTRDAPSLEDNNADNKHQQTEREKDKMPRMQTNLLSKLRQPLRTHIPSHGSTHRHARHCHIKDAAREQCQDAARRSSVDLADGYFLRAAAEVSITELRKRETSQYILRCNSSTLTKCSPTSGKVSFIKAFS